MSIKRDDLDAGRVDFSEVATAKRLPLVHPGEILRDDFLQPMKISVYTLAQAIKVPRSRVNDIVASVVRIERSEIRDDPTHAIIPDFASLNPGYLLLAENDASPP